jgi:hypothetical protein
LATLLAACGDDSRKTSSDTTVAAAADTTAAPAAATTAAPAADTTAAPATTVAGPTFGDSPWPCGPAAAGVTNKATEQGVTADSINIAYGDDAGYAAAPGLNHEISDAIKAAIKKCNELGGIAGRKLVGDYYDAKILEVKAAMTAACAKDFFLVGEGWSLDAGQEETRLGCGLPAAPTYTVSASFAMSKDVYQGVPNPADEIPSTVFTQIAKLFPDKIAHAASLAGNYSATQESTLKTEVGSAKLGFTWVKHVEYNIGGEKDWTPFVKQLKDAGAKVVFFSGSPLPNYQKFRQTAKLNGLDYPDVIFLTDANFYTAQTATANTDGAMDGTFVREAFTPLEEGSSSKAVQDYLDLIKTYGGDSSQLGEQGLSSFFLWAQSARDCGADLTRACVVANMGKVSEWTGYGMHSKSNPAQNHPPACGLVLLLKGNAYTRAAPTDAKTNFDCPADGGIVKLPADLKTLVPLKLDADRHSHQFDK